MEKRFHQLLRLQKTANCLSASLQGDRLCQTMKEQLMAAKRKMGTNFKYKINGKEYTPQQISAFISRK